MLEGLCFPLNSINNLEFIQYSSKMQVSWELPVIINEISQQKYNSFTLYQAFQSQKFKNYVKKDKKENIHPFRCLKKNSHFSKCNNMIMKTNRNIRPTIQCTPKNRNSIFLYSTHQPSYKKATIHANGTTPKIFILKAFSQLKTCIKPYTKNPNEYFIQDINLLCQLKVDQSQIHDKLIEFKQNNKIILDPLVNIIYHSLCAQSIIRKEEKLECIFHLKKSFYYALKIGLFTFAVYCIAEEAEIYKSLYNLEKGLDCLKKALGISIHLQNNQIQLQILQKIGLMYYYTGNILMGEYYHKLADRGFNSSQLQIHRKEFNLDGLLNSLQQQIFIIQSTKHIVDPNINNLQIENYIKIQEQSIAKNSKDNKKMLEVMLKDKSEKKKGQKMRSHIKNTLSLAKITPHSFSPPKQELHTEFLPFINTSQVLKSHLSKNRLGGRQNRQWKTKCLLQMIDIMAKV